MISIQYRITNRHAHDSKLHFDAAARNRSEEMFIDPPMTSKSERTLEQIKSAPTWIAMAKFAGASECMARRQEYENRDSEKQC